MDGGWKPKAGAGKTSVSSKYSQLLMPKKQSESGNPFRYGAAELAEGGVQVFGCIPRGGDHIRFNYQLGGQVKGQYRKVEGKPAVDHRHLRVVTSVQGLYANPVLLVDAMRALECARAADAAAVPSKTK
jgi:hypothetical protein